MTYPEPIPLVEELREEMVRLSGQSIDRGCADSGIAANLAEKAADHIERLTEALEGLADVVEHECDCPPCIGSMAAGEHYLGLARAALAAAPSSSSETTHQEQGQ